jgi:hypothetical protein
MTSPVGGQAIQVVGLRQINLVDNTPGSGAGDPSLMDSGANICLTCNLNSLINITPIVPFPISVATKGSTPTLDNFCTMQGLLLLYLLPMGPITINRATFAKMQQRKLSLPRQFLHTGRCCITGRKRATRATTQIDYLYKQ